VAESNERSAAEVRDEEGNLGGAKRVSQALGEDVSRGDRRCVLYGCEQPREVQSRVLMLGHRLQRRRGSGEVVSDGCVTRARSASYGYARPRLRLRAARSATADDQDEHAGFHLPL
jgi:hypothetical protein